MDKKLNILILYSCSEFPFRKTFSAFLKSFQKYSNHKIYLVNFPFFFPKKALGTIEWDLIIFSHSFTAPWNRERYLKKIQCLEAMGLKSTMKIAFFQDEYFNSDLTNLFISKFEIDNVYTVVPENEWNKIYPDVLKENMTLYLTGYISDDDVKEANDILARKSKDIGISYRTAYPGPQMAVLGKVGWLKYRIADFGNRLNIPNSDIQVGSGFLTGNSWFELLARSRFTLGVPSGSNVLDVDGSISSLLAKKQNYDIAELTQLFEAKNISQDYKLEVISPRIFEAGMFNCCQILVEGNYSNILTKYKHYIPVSVELDNLDEVKELIKNEAYVQEVITNFRNDVINNPSLSYSHFIKTFFNKWDFAPNGRMTVLQSLRVKTGSCIAYLMLRLYNNRFAQLGIKR